MQKLNVRLKSEDDIRRIAESGKIISGIFKSIGGMRLEGMSTLDLDSCVEKLILQNKARPSFKTVPNYHHATCVSINEQVVHGVPSKKNIIRNGDIVKVDIGVVKNGFFSDACRTFIIGDAPENAVRLVEVTNNCLEMAIDVMVPGNRLGDIGAVIQGFAEKNGYSVVRDFTGHGVGFAVHEFPNVSHYGRKNTGLILQPGMVLAIEPMINEGRHHVMILEDGWTAVTVDGSLSAQFEHTIAVTPDGPLVLTR